MQRPLRINNQIRVAEINVIDDDGKQLGIMRTSDALRVAQQKDLDLVEVGPTAQPPVAKIMDYGRYTYQQEKQEKKSAVKHKVQETKTVRVGFKTGEHDLAFKAKKADEFLLEGHILKLELTLRGREKGLAHLGKERLEKFIQKLQTPIAMQGPPQRGPYGWVVMVQLDKRAIQQKAKQPSERNEAQEHPNESR